MLKSKIGDSLLNLIILQLQATKEYQSDKLLEDLLNFFVRLVKVCSDEQKKVNLYFFDN